MRSGIPVCQRADVTLLYIYSGQGSGKSYEPLQWRSYRTRKPTACEYLNWAKVGITYIYTVTCEADWCATSQFTNEPALHEPVEKVGIGHLLIGVDIITERRPVQPACRLELCRYIFKNGRSKTKYKCENNNVLKHSRTAQLRGRIGPMP